MEETKSALEYRRARRLAGKGPEPRQFVETLRAITLDGEGHLYAAGDSVVKVFDEQGVLLRQWPTARPGFSIAVNGEGHVWVGQERQVEVFDLEGKLEETWRDSERLGLVTAIAVDAADVFFGDAKARCIRHYDRDHNFLNNIGDRHRKGGFDIPNGVVDFAVDGRGLVHVPNPGMHRVERYTADGELVGRFGRFDGQDPEGFPGCCNPTNLTLDRAGRVIVSEKAPPRVKVYDPSGLLLAVVADEGFELTAKNLDLAVDASGTIYVIDTTSLEIHVFSPTSSE